MTPFHLAFPVRDLDETRTFYSEVLGCAIGRSSATWIDFDLYGHQMSAHLRPAQAASDGKVDGITVPIPHFGAVLLMDDWQRLATRLEARDDIDWLERPMVRFKGEPGEQATLFIRDPSGNALEFKGFRSLEQVFAH
ncbi:dioxygenase [Mesorhizobium sp. B2-4-12]|uniref:VOC family protein n=1 Tax=unclassified Mesorhizobium TaxID=325217 RepID=UPI00112D85C3|nr:MULTISPECIES: VOC family protein [unclassified Mesorhizobium]TPK85373.1 dioxygenase [Mesorhizobium sp. B2-4-12]TPK87439.1 dioxygenase [Mesorhizobium sp. B2-4-17]TPL02866.1 dioxygenase [Mesorhizobium sp. B2-4-14]